MVWRSDAPQGQEAAKVRLDLVRYMRGVVLDLGCGPQKVFATATGVDDDSDLARFGIRSQPDVKSGCERLPFTDGYADTIFSSHLLEHIVDHEAALADWWRVLKPGGVLILYLPHADWYPNRGMPGSNPDHKHDFRNADLTRAMTAVAQRSGFGWDQINDEVRSGGLEYSFLQIYRKRDDAEITLHKPQPRTEKKLGIVRLGAHGDALWLSALLPALKKQGWHITVYTQVEGELALRHDPNIDDMIVQPRGLFGSKDEEVPWTAQYWLHEEPKYDRFINFTGCVERLLVRPSEFAFYYAKEQRHALMDVNYIEALAKWARIPFDAKTVRVKFYPSDEERAWALAERAKYPGALVMINPVGSSLPKYWPHAQKLMELLDAEGIYSLLVGELRGKVYDPPARAKVIGKDWGIRKVWALAQLANVVIGTESALVNAVAHDNPLKIVLLSHSSHENLTRDWVNTIAVAAKDLACYPCHRIHQDASHCNFVGEAAACQELADPQALFECCTKWLDRVQEAA